MAMFVFKGRPIACPQDVPGGRHAEVLQALDEANTDGAFSGLIEGIENHFGLLVAWGHDE